MLNEAEREKEIRMHAVNPVLYLALHTSLGRETLPREASPSVDTAEIMLHHAFQKNILQVKHSQDTVHRYAFNLPRF